MKKIIFFVIILFPLCSFSQTTYRYNIYLSNPNLAPEFGIIKGDYKYIGPDNNLKAFFANYSVQKFSKEFPSITDDEYFNKILRLETTSSTLANDLLITYPSIYLKMSDISNFPLVELLSYPNDYGTTSPNTNLGATVERSDLDYMETNRAWDISTGLDLTTNQPIAIGISDAFINTTDDDFINKVTYLNPYSGTNPHGTEVAGIAAARGNNAYGSTGVCYDCNIVHVEFGNFDLLEQLATSGVRIINMSWAYMFSSPLFFDSNTHETHQRLISRLVDRYRTVLIAGAGNQSSYQTSTDWYCENGNNNGPSFTGTRFGYPACFDGVISVSSVIHKYPFTLPLSTSHPSFSSTSPTGVQCYSLQGAVGTVDGINPNNPVGVLFNGWARYCNIGQPNQYISSPNGLSDGGHTKNPQVDILAPTHDTFKFNIFVQNGSIVYGGGGTSGSAPRVSGTAALMISVNDCLYPDEVDTILKLTSNDVENLLSINQVYSGNIGAGSLNTGNAVVFVNEMKKTNGIAEIKDHIFNRFDFILDKINNKLSIEKVSFKDNCIADFTARNEIRVLPGTRFNPNNSGKVNLRINPGMDIGCTPIEYPEPPSNKTGNVDKNLKTILYPNPNNGTFDLYNIDFEKFGSYNISAIVFDINGRKLFEKSISKSDDAHFDIGNLKTGMYILKLQSDNESEEIKFIKN